MHKDFARWYSAASIDTSPEDLDVAWSNVEALLKDLDETTAIELVRQAYRLPSRTDSIWESSGPSSSSKDLEFERALLAASALAASLGTASAASDVAALACLSRHAATLDAPVIIELPSESERYLELRSVAKRRRVTVAVPKLTSKAAFAKRFEPIALALEQNSLPAIKDGLNACLEGVYQDYVTLGSGASSALTQMGAMLDAQAEESSMYWWTYNGISQDLAVRLDALEGVGVASLVAAKELADLTTIVPGPRSAPALLAHVLSAGGGDPNEKLELVDAINASPRDWRQAAADAYFDGALADITPVLCAISSSLLTDDPGHWASVARKSALLNHDITLSASELAHQLYREAVLMKALR